MSRSSITLLNCPWWLFYLVHLVRSCLFKSLSPPRLSFLSSTNPTPHPDIQPPSRTYPPRPPVDANTSISLFGAPVMVAETAIGARHGIPVGAGYARGGTSALRLDRGRGAAYNAIPGIAGLRTWRVNETYDG